jgi:hypothetical protein
MWVIQAADRTRLSIDKCCLGDHSILGQMLVRPGLLPGGVVQGALFIFASTLSSCAAAAVQRISTRMLYGVPNVWHSGDG